MKTIAWDIDDVLNDFTRTWLERAWRPAHPDCSVRYEALRENPPCKILRCELSEYRASLDAFRQSNAAREMPPADAALAWFECHGQRFRHIAVTAVPMAAAPWSAWWCMRHFGRWIRTFHVVPSFRPGENLPEYDRTKGQSLEQWKHVDLLVDDDPRNLASAESLGIQTLCFPRPWNEASSNVATVLDRLTTL
ncbi:MAG: hypothetical protein ABFC77_01305 [Thermoguttaceae bacterium]